MRTQAHVMDGEYETRQHSLDRGGDTIDVFHDANVRAGLRLPQRVLRLQQQSPGRRRIAHAGRETVSSLPMGSIRR